VSEFNDAGVPAIHVDSYTSIGERDDVYTAFENGEFKILSCSQLLGVGVDMPFVKCLIDCYPVKSLITYIQRGGRIIRNFPGVEYGIYLDHAGNWSHFGGGIEEFYPTDLDDGTKKLDEKKLCKKDKKEAKEKECPMCYTPFFGMKCDCGYEIDNKKAYEEGKELMQTDGSDLVELKSSKKKKLTPAEKRNKEATKADKQQFYSELIGYKLGRESKGAKVEMSRMDSVYKRYFGVWPKGINPVPTAPTVATVKYITGVNITNSKRRW
jgi:superfamily II DNA or RNA helicase